jgi:hypothetical protein
LKLNLEESVFISVRIFFLFVPVTEYGTGSCQTKCYGAQIIFIGKYFYLTFSYDIFLVFIAKANSQPACISLEDLGCKNQCCGSGPFWSDPDVWDRIRFLIRILAFINDSISTFLVCVKAINTVLNESMLFNFLVHEDRR